MSDGRLGLYLALAAVIVGSGLGMTQRPQTMTPQPPEPGNTIVQQSGMVEVHVVGWVASPGVVSVPSSALVVDAIQAAGGLRAGALTEAINLAAPVTAGQQIVVPGPDSQMPGNENDGSNDGLVVVNQATAAELETLPGVGPVLAARIIAYRDQNGPFSQVEDLLGVSGIGEATLSSLRDLIRVP